MDAKLSTTLGAIATLVTLAGAMFGVDNFYVRKAEAADKYAQQVAVQERDRIEVELQVIRLELEFLSTQYDDLTLTEGTREKLRERKQYLRKREEILEQRLIALRDKL